METKRYIGNDTTRIFARVRAELGPDAVIVRTRSLLREGAEPLIEVLAAAAAEPGLSLALQRSLIEGALDRVEFEGKPLTVGDLEDLATREGAAGELAYAPSAPAPREDDLAPAWLEGFVAAPPAEPLRQVPPADASEPFLPPRSTPAPPPVEWGSRPRIVTRERPPASSAAPTPLGERFTPVEPGVAGLLVASGFSVEAARIAAAAAPGEHDPARALEAAIASREAAYPVDGRTAIISIQGPAGAGRTTALMRMALDCADAGRTAILVAADTSHTGGPAQVHAYGEAIGIPVFDAFSPQEFVHAVTRAPRGACIFVDVPPGRWAPPPIPSVDHFAYLAMPAHWNSTTLNAQLAAFDTSACSGAVVTHTDLVAGLAPVLSLVLETQLGLAFLSSGRDVSTGIEVADPLTLASGVFTTSSRETTNGRLVATA